MYRGSTGKPGVFSHGFGYLADRHPIPQKGGAHGDDADGSHIDANRPEVSEQQLASEQQQQDLVADRAGDTEEYNHTTSPCLLPAARVSSDPALGPQPQRKRRQYHHLPPPAPRPPNPTRTNP